VGPQGNVGAPGFNGPVTCYGGSQYPLGYGCYDACNFGLSDCTFYWQNLGVGYYFYNTYSTCSSSDTSAWYCGLSVVAIFGTCYYYNASGYIYDSGSCSDRKIKTDIETIENGLKLLLQLEPVEFDWNETFYQIKSGWPEEKKHSVGFIAQEV
jgi:hypothetical protein